MEFDLLEINNFPSEDLRMIRDRVELTLQGRRREALLRFREANPVLGMALRDGDNFVGYYEIGFGLPQFALNLISQDLETGWVVERIYNPDLLDLLLESNNDRDHPIVHYINELNTSSGEVWVDPELAI